MTLHSRRSRASRTFIHAAAFSLICAWCSGVQATTFTVSARFADGGIQQQTLFNGWFDWDGELVTNFQGNLTEALWAWNGNSYQESGTFESLAPNGQAPVLSLTYQLGPQSLPDADGDVSVSVFLLNDTNVFSGGGYATGDALKYGFLDGNTPNQNAYFTLAFNAADPVNTVTAVHKLVYADATPHGLMGPLLTGGVVMTGHADTGVGYFGSLGGVPIELSISAPVPLPGAVWLFGVGLLGLGRLTARLKLAPTDIAESIRP